MKNNQREMKKVGGNGHKTNWLQILKNHFTDLKGAGWTNENLTTIDGLVDDLVTAIGAIEGATTLHNKLTNVRAGYLDELVAGGAMHDALIAGAAGANIAADIIAVKAETALIVADTNEVQVSLANGGFTDLLIDAIKGVVDDILADTSVLTLAAIEGEAVDALESFDLDHLINIAHPTGDPVADSLMDLIMNKDVGQTFSRATDSLEALQELISGIAGVNTYQEQIPDTDFALAAIDDEPLTADPPDADAENAVVDIDANAGDTFVLRSLFVNVTSFGTTGGTKLTFSLWVPINGVITKVDSVDVDVLGFQNLADLFGLQEVHGDSIHITVVTDATDDPGDAACSGTFKYAKAS
jgi:hypothetical protein